MEKNQPLSKVIQTDVKKSLSGVGNISPTASTSVNTGKTPSQSGNTSNNSGKGGNTTKGK